jgi:hypothetical protein
MVALKASISGTLAMAMFFQLLIHRQSIIVSSFSIHVGPWVGAGSYWSCWHLIPGKCCWKASMDELFQL